MFDSIKRWLLDRKELAEHRAAASYHKRVESDLSRTMVDLAEAKKALAKSESQAFIYRSLLGHLAVVAADVAKCKSTCKLCRGLLAQPLWLAKDALTKGGTNDGLPG